MNSFVLFGLLLRLIVDLFYTLVNVLTKLYLDHIVFTLGKRNLEDEQDDSDKGPSKNIKQDITENSEQDSELPENSELEPNQETSDEETDEDNIHYYLIDETEYPDSDEESNDDSDDSDEDPDDDSNDDSDDSEGDSGVKSEENGESKYDKETEEVPSEVPSTTTPPFPESDTTASNTYIPDGLGISLDDID
jgi:hypothetical protein